MNAKEMLKLLNEGRTEELKTILQKEIMEAELKRTPSEKKRFAAMKRYFSFVTGIVNPVCQMPCVLTIDGETKTAFTNGQSAILAKESCLPMETISPERYVKIHKDIKHTGEKAQVDITKAIAKAKSLGYKINKKEVLGPGGDCNFAFYYDGAYFKVGLVDATYAVINDGGKCIISHEAGKERMPITIESTLGLAMILPFYCLNPEDRVVIDLATAEQIY